jgi:hypothetical protein
VGLLDFMMEIEGGSRYLALWELSRPQGAFLQTKKKTLKFKVFF